MTKMLVATQAMSHEWCKDEQAVNNTKSVICRNHIKFLNILAYKSRSRIASKASLVHACIVRVLKYW